MPVVASRIATELTELSDFIAFILGSRWAERQGEPGICDFMLGNPHDGVIPEFTTALSKAVQPLRPDWHAYKTSEPESQQIVAESLTRRTGIAFDPADVAMTNGAFTALSISMLAILEPGDEVIYVSPPWFFYRTLIRGAGGVPVRVDVDPVTLDIDPAAIERAITPRTRAVLINSPHNPIGRIASRAILQELATRLEHASASLERPIFLISDEAYNRIVFDGLDCPSPAEYYPRTFIVYTYGKTLLAPGERIGYVATPPAMPGREELRNALIVAQLMTGYGFPNASLQYALPDLETLSIDIPRLQKRRDALIGCMLDAGYELTIPQGTFYIVAKAPGGDDRAFADRLADDDVFVLPGSYFEMPGYFRISLTATDAMVEKAIPLLKSAIG